MTKYKQVNLIQLNLSYRLHTDEVGDIQETQLGLYTKKGKIYEKVGGWWDAQYRIKRTATQTVNYAIVTYASYSCEFMHMTIDLSFYAEEGYVETAKQQVLQTLKKLVSNMSEDIQKAKTMVTNHYESQMSLQT